jgi:hypothetical protein
VFSITSNSHEVAEIANQLTYTYTKPCSILSRILDPDIHSKCRPTSDLVNVNISECKYVVEGPSKNVIVSDAGITVNLC